MYLMQYQFTKYKFPKPQEKGKKDIPQLLRPQEEFFYEALESLTIH